MLSKEDKSLASGCSTLGAEDGEAVSCKCWEKWIQPRTWLSAKLTPRWGKIDFRQARTQNLCLHSLWQSTWVELMLWKDESVNQEKGRTGILERVDVPQERGVGGRDVSERQKSSRLTWSRRNGGPGRDSSGQNGDSWNKWDGRSLGQDKKQMDGRADRAFETQVLFT